MKILTPEGEEKLSKAKDDMICRLHNLGEWCSNHMLLLVFADICWTVTPFMFYFADLERGYDALGGEAFIPVMPFFIWLIEKAIEDDKK